MNYITNYYKNLCEQLQEKINILEANIRSASEIEELGSKEYEKALKNKERELGRRLTQDEISDIANATIGPYTRRAASRERLISRASASLPSVARAGDVQTATQFADVFRDISKTTGTGKFAGYRNLPPEVAREVQSGVKSITQSGRNIRSFGVETSVPADIAAMRKFVQMGKGRYQPPTHVSPSTQY